MMRGAVLLFFMAIAMPLWSQATDPALQQEIQRLRTQTKQLQAQIDLLARQMQQQTTPAKVSTSPKVSTPPKASTPAKVSTPPLAAQTAPKPGVTIVAQPVKAFHTTTITVNEFDGDPESLEFYPAALMADEHVVTYIAGTPIVSSPYLGSRPAFDGSDYIVNISSINRDIRLMQQRRRLYRAYQQIGYPSPNTPILAFSGKVEPVALVGRPFVGETTGDITLGSSEIDLAAAVNHVVEAYIGIAYNDAPAYVSGPRVANGSIGLNLGFVNIGDLDRSPIYFTAGQIYVPFGRYSTSMASPTLPMRLSRTRTRPFILGYKSQQDAGVFAAIYGFRSDTTLGTAGIGGGNLGYIFDTKKGTGEIGISYISSLNDAAGMQNNGSSPQSGLFGGFGSVSNGNENVRKVSGLDVHLNLSISRYTLMAEWVTALDAFRPQDLSYNGIGAKPQAGQIEGGVTFMLFDRPSSVSTGYQWSRQTLALNIPEQRVNAAYNISIWKDTVETLEYRHDIDFNSRQFANGAAPPGGSNINTVGTNSAADTVLLQIGVYF